jgi:lipoate-protein ligase B
MLTEQHACRDAVAAGTAPETLFLLEHPPTITLGRDAKEAHLLLHRDALRARGIAVVEVDRGGDVTYHGPGQLVAYPILDLQRRRPSVGWYLRTLEEVLIQTLADFGIAGERLEGYTGVWVGGAKIAAIGVGVRHWITCHGIALNVAPDMEHFGLIVPCGIPDKPVTSMARLLGTPPPLTEVRDRFVHHFLAGFGMRGACLERSGDAID